MIIKYSPIRKSVICHADKKLAHTENIEHNDFALGGDACQPESISLQFVADRMSNNAGSRRLIWADMLKCFAIFLVLWGHSIQHLTPSGFMDNPVFRLIYSFHMPLFMIISGYFASGIIKKSWKNLLVKKSLQLVVPTIIPTIICCAIIYYRGG